MRMLTAADRRVVVTAGAGGIGLAIVEALVEAGAKVHICDVDASALEACRARLGVTTSLADISDEDAVDRLFADAQEALGGLDALINNAGIAGPTGAVEELSSPIGGAASRWIWSGSFCARGGPCRC